MRTKNKRKCFYFLQIENPEVFFKQRLIKSTSLKILLAKCTCTQIVYTNIKQENLTDKNIKLP